MKPESVYTIFGMRGHAVGHDITLDGPVFRDSSTNKTAKLFGVDLAALEERVRKWVELNALYAGLLSEIQKGIELKIESATVVEELNAFEQRGLLKKPPYPLSYYDTLLADIETLQQTIDSDTMNQKATQRIMDESRADWRDAQDRLLAIERLKERQESAKGLWTREGLQLETRLAAARVRLYPIVAKVGGLPPNYGGKCEAVVFYCERLPTRDMES